MRHLNYKLKLAMKHLLLHDVENFPLPMAYGAQHQIQKRCSSEQDTSADVILMPFLKMLHLLVLSFEGAQSLRQDT